MDRMKEAFSCMVAACLSSYKMLKTLLVTILLMFGPVTLLGVLKCVTILFYLMTERSV